VTGQIAGMAGAYGNVGAVVYLFIFMFVDSSTFFLIISAGAFLSWAVCWMWLKEPEGGFDEEYVLSSVDHAIAAEARVKRDTEAEITRLFAGSHKVELAERGAGLTLTARFTDMDELQRVVGRLRQVPEASQT